MLNMEFIHTSETMYEKASPCAGKRMKEILVTCCITDSSLE